MFTIDLLKGHGVPIRSGPKGIAVAAVTFAVPVITAIVMLGCYLQTTIVMSMQKGHIANYETRIEEFSEAMELQESHLQEKDDINNRLSKVSSSIGKHIQWSPIVAEVVGNMPDSVALVSLVVKQRLVKRKVPSADNADEMVEVTVPARTLQVNVYARLHSDRSIEIRDFRDNLRFSPLLEQKLENIRVSQKAGRLDGRDVVFYEINCDFE